MANRVMKQKSEKGKKQARDASEARKYGVRDTASYRKEMLHTTERPSKEEREKDSAAASEHFEKIAKDPGKVLDGRSQATRLEKVGGKVVNKPTGKLAAGRDQASVDIETSLVKREYVSGVNKRNAKRDEAASKVDLTPEQKAGRIARRSEAANKAKAANAAKPVGRLPEAQTDRPSTRPLKVKKVNGKTTTTGGAQIIPGEGSAGILNPGNIARRAGDMTPRKRRKMERKAAYNVKNANKSAGYEKAARLSQDTADAVNSKNKIETEKMDLSARKKAAKIDTSKDSLKTSIKKRAEKMPEGPEKEAVKNNAEKIIREPKVDGVRGGLHAEIARPDERDITKKYTRVAPVGGVRKTEVAAALPNSPRSTRLPAQKIKMSRGGTIEAQPDRPVETGMGLMGSHEDRLHKITKDFQVPAGDTSHPLEHIHLRSFLRHASESKGLKYDERGSIKALWEAKQKHPEMYKSIHQQALAHRTKRIGQITQQREKSKSKAKEMRQLNSEARGGKRQAPKALRIMSNVSNKFTEVPRGGSEA